MTQNKIKISNDIEIELAWCPSGSFRAITKGSSLFYKTKKSEIEIIFSKGFWITIFPITSSIWNEVIGEKNRFKDFKKDMPIFGIDYKEANSFLEILNKLVKERYGMDVFFEIPNYLQWQYACEAKRSGNEPNFWGNISEFESFAWFKNNAGNSVHEVGLKKANPWGIYDMYGNTLEMCIDVIANDNMLEIIDPKSTLDGETITVMGGDYLSNFEDCQTPKKRFIALENSFVEPLSLRLVITPTPTINFL